MFENKFNTNTINSEADSAVRGIFYQKLRAFNRLLDAIDSENMGIMCAIEYIDDVIEVDGSNLGKVITTEQDKLKCRPVSLNSHEVINSLRIFFDNWREKTMNSEKINFAFFTNSSIAKEKSTQLLKQAGVELPEKPILELLISLKYDDVLEPFKVVFKDYYIQQHEKNLKENEKSKIAIYKSIVDMMSDDEWKSFLSLIEWNFGIEDELDLQTKTKERIEKLCKEYDVKNRYVDSIFNEVMSMIEVGAFESDFLNKVVHVSQVKLLFVEKTKKIEREEILDPMHKKWDEIVCNDIRNLQEKIESVCLDYGDDIEELQDDYIEGAYEQDNHINKKAVKAFKYRIYKKCERKLKKIKLDLEQNELSKEDVDRYIDEMTDECESLILDKSKTYSTIPFKDRDMIRKTVLILFEECYIAFDQEVV